MRVLLIAPEMQQPMMPAELASLTAACADINSRKSSALLQDAGVVRPSPYVGFQLSRGLLLIASYLERSGHEVRYQQMDYAIGKYGRAQALTALRENAEWAQVVGATSFTPNYPTALNYLSLVKSWNASIATVIGGPHATYTDQECILEGSIDFVIRGEGAGSMLELLEALAGHLSFDKVSNLTYRVGKAQDSIRIIKNQGGRIDDFENEPLPAYHLAPSADSGELGIVVETSRGCPFKCSFCVETNFWTSTRFRSISAVIEELALVRDLYGYDLVHLADPIFPLKRRRVMEFCSELEGRLPGMKLSCNIRSELDDAEMLAALSRAGVLVYFLGLESASDTMLTIMNKRASFQKYKNFLATSRKYTGVMSTSWMIGHPGETQVTADQSLEGMTQLVRSGLIDEVWPRLFIPYPGIPSLLGTDEAAVDVTSRDWASYATLAVGDTYAIRSMTATGIIRAYASFMLAYIDLHDVDGKDGLRREATDFLGRLAA